MRKAKADSTVEVTRLGKDEVNLVEHPFAGLSDKPGAQVIENEWEARHPLTGQAITSRWRVEGSAQLGLPTAVDERVYLVLMELTREAGFAQQVHFSRYGILKRLGWSDNARSYESLRDALRRLNSVTITSENALWNPDAQAFVDVGFSILDSFRIIAGEPGRKSADSDAVPPSYFIWSRELFDSFRHGQIRSIDLGFALSLKGAIALRLYRYLDKKAYDGKTSFEIELKRLCEAHLGMASATYTSTLKTRLQPAHEELQARGFLSETTFEPMKTRKGEKVCYTFPLTKSLKPADAPTEAALSAAKPKARRGRPPKLASAAQLSLQLPEQVSDRSDTQNGVPDNREADLMQRMLSLKVSPAVARELLRDVPEDKLRLHLDCLDDRDPRDPAATFVRAVREGWEVPAKYLERVEAQKRAKMARAARESRKARAAQEEASTALKKASQEQESEVLDAAWENLGPEARQEIEREAIDRLGVLGRMGRAKGALDAMRRSIQRERMEWSSTPEVSDRSDTSVE